MWQTAQEDETESLHLCIFCSHVHSRKKLPLKDHYRFLPQPVKCLSQNRSPTAYAVSAIQAPFPPGWSARYNTHFHSKSFCFMLLCGKTPLTQNWDFSAGTSQIKGRLNFRHYNVSCGVCKIKGSNAPKLGPLLYHVKGYQQAKKKDFKDNWLVKMQNACCRGRLGPSYAWNIKTFRSFLAHLLWTCWRRPICCWPINLK